MKDLDLEIYLQNIRPLSEGVFSFNNKEMKYNELVSFIQKRMKDNKKLIRSLWEELKDYIKTYNESYVDKKYQNIIEDKYINIFIFSIKSLYDLSSYFQSLYDNNTVHYIYECISSDYKRFSFSFMLKIIDYKMVIEWIHHCILKDLYLIDLLSKWNRISKIKTAGGTSGPWSNIDLPMQERVYEWDKDGVEEELSGRTKQRMKQPRYWTGIEGYNDPRVREGFVWRDIKNDPYSIEDEDDNPYPHRNLLWNS